MPIADEDRVVFSVLYNESAGFLASLIGNFLAHTGPESVLVLNLPPGRALPAVPAAGAGRVFPINGAVPRRKLGHTLLVGHLEAFGFAQARLGAFGHFCPLASNALLVRRFDRDATLAELAAHRHVPTLDLADPPDYWWWPFIRRNPRLIRGLAEEWGITRSLGGQIEGLFAARADWGLLHARFDDILAMGGWIEPEHAFPLEEVLPVAVFVNHGSGHYLNLCEVLWTRPDGGKVTLGDLLDAPRDKPAHVAAMKWFDRTALAPVTAAVTEPWGLALLEAWRGADAVGRLGQRRLLEQFAATLRQREEFRPFGANWWPEGTPPRGFGLASRPLEMRLDRLLVPTGEAVADAAEAVFVFLGDSGRRIGFGLWVDEALGATRLRIDCTALDPPVVNLRGADPGVAEGHVYLNALEAAGPGQPGPWTCRLRLRLPVPPDQEAAMRRLVLAREGRFQDAGLAHYVVEAAGYREYHFLFGETGTEGPLALGIPFQPNCHFEALLDRIGP